MSGLLIKCEVKVVNAALLTDDIEFHACNCKAISIVVVGYMVQMCL